METPQITTVAPLINGVEYGWASVNMMIAGMQTVGVTAFDFQEKQTKEKAIINHLFQVIRVNIFFILFSI